MTEPLTGTLLIVSGDCAEEPGVQLEQLARAPSVRLGHRIDLCLAKEPAGSMAAGMRTLVASGAQRIVIVPLGLPPQEGPGQTPLAIKWASRRWPFLTFHAASPLDWQECAAWLNDVALEAVTGTAKQAAQSVVLLVGAGGPDSLANANLARLAHLVRNQGASEFARVDYAFLDAGQPCIPEALQMQPRLDKRNIIVVAWLLYTCEALQRVKDQVKQAARECVLDAAVAAAPLSHPTLIDSLISHHQEALADDSFLAPELDGNPSGDCPHPGAYYTCFKRNHCGGRGSAPGAGSKD